MRKSVNITKEKQQTFLNKKGVGNRKNKELNDTENNDDSNDSSNEMKSSDGEYKQVESNNEGIDKFKDLSKDYITSLIESLQKLLDQSQ